MPEAAVDAPNPSAVDPGLQGGKNLEQDTYSVEDAMEEGAALAMEEVQDRLDDAGLEMDAETGEIIGGEAAFDPRSRRKGTRRRTTKGRRKGTRRRGRIAMARHPALVYDPRSRLSRARGYARRAKDPLSKVLNKVAPFASVIGMAGTYYTSYKKKAGTASVADRITADLKNFDMKAATDRIIANAGEIATPAILGYIIKQVPIGPTKVRQIVGNAMMGASGGLLAYHVTDPPETGTGSFPINGGAVHGTAAPGGVPSWGGM